MLFERTSTSVYWIQALYFTGKHLHRRFHQESRVKQNHLSRVIEGVSWINQKHVHFLLWSETCSNHVPYNINFLPCFLHGFDASIKENVIQKDLDASSKGTMERVEQGQDYSLKLIGSKQLNYFHQIMCRATSSKWQWIKQSWILTFFLH